MDQISHYESKGWTRTGLTDAYNNMHVHIMSINAEIDDTEEITQPPD